MSKDKDNILENEVKFDPLDLLANFNTLLKSENELNFLEENNDDIQEKLKNLKNLFNKADDIKKRAEKQLEELQKNKNNSDINKIEDAKKEAEKGISEHLDWHEVHKNARQLWETLMSAAIKFIDPSSKGNSKLFEYLEDSSKFEDVLYGLEDYYRDHTLHSIWVYLMGVQLMCEGGILSNVSKKLNWYLFNDIEAGADRYPYPPHLQHWAKLRENIFIKQFQYYKDSVWCIMALCHDLGYSLAKLDKLNKRVLDVLKYFHISEFKRVGYSLDIEHQYLLEQFLEIMAMDVRIVPGENYQDLEEDSMKNHYGRKNRFKSSLKRLMKDIKNQETILKKIDDSIDVDGINKHNTIAVISEIYEKQKDGKTIISIIKDIEEETQVKCYRDDSTYWRLCKALERKEHGILSAYLIYKTLGIFADTSIRGASEEWGLEDQEIIYNVIRGDILFAITQHDFAYTHINQLGSLAEILILCDELEEFTRLGRKMLSREYTDTTAETKIKVSGITLAENEEKMKDSPISIELTYESKHKEIEDFYNFVWRKMTRVCTLYSLSQTKDQSEIVYFPIQEIKVHFNYSLFNTGEPSKKFHSPIQDKEVSLDKYKKFEFTFTMKKEGDDGKFTAVFSEAEVDSSQKPVKRHFVLKCVDDRIMIINSKMDKCNNNIEQNSLKKLFKIK